MFSTLLMISFINLINVTNGFNSRKKQFFLEPNRRLSSGIPLFNDPYLTRSNIECSLLCEQELRCRSAEFDKGTSLCKLHGQSSMIQATETAIGFTVLKDSYSMEVTTAALQTTETIYKATTTDSRVPFPMRFDSLAMHQNVYLSIDRLTMTDKYDPSMMGYSWSLTPLYRYRGAIATNCIPKDKSVYFEINYDYDIVSQPVIHSVFEIGLAERRKVDNGLYCGTLDIGGWAFAISKCPYSTSASVCLEAWHLSVQKFSMAWGYNQIGERKTGKFEFVVNRKDNSFALYSHSSSSLLYKFTNVQSNVELCPIFSVHGSTSKGFTVILSLSNVYEV